MSEAHKILVQVEPGHGLVVTTPSGEIEIYTHFSVEEWEELLPHVREREATEAIENWFSFRVRWREATASGEEVTP